ncbi:MAG: glycosyltransferase family 2 protein [Flavobacteriales bacterium]
MNKYLAKYGFQAPKITKVPDENLGIIIVIPCHNEENVTRTLYSLKACSSSQCGVKTIIVINQSEIISEEIDAQNHKSEAEINTWKQENPSFDVEVIFEKALSKKHAGVGLARKIGMDEAVNLFHQINKDGIIVALDADCEVETNYLQEIERHFKKYPKTNGSSIRYAHPLQGEEYEEIIYQGIINYELHLRYYNQAMRYCGLPYGFHTVGSSMAVKSSAYQKQGGMNKRKAGEDFYFLQKIIELGNFTELNSTCVIPSPRISDRVPFGTGKAIGDWIASEELVYFTYDFTSFLMLKELIENISNIYNRVGYIINSEVLLQFMKSIDFENKIEEIRENTTNYLNFEKRFFTFFNAFQVLKYVHFVRDNSLPTLPVKEEASKLLKLAYSQDCEKKSIIEILEIYRTIEKNSEMGK